MRAAGLQVADLFGTEKPDYPRTRAWGLYIWQNVPSAQGLYWMSVRENTCPVVMLFGDRVAKTALVDARASLHIRHFESIVFDLIDALGGGLAV